LTAPPAAALNKKVIEVVLGESHVVGKHQKAMRKPNLQGLAVEVNNLTTSC